VLASVIGKMPAATPARRTNWIEVFK